MCLDSQQSQASRKSMKSQKSQESVICLEESQQSKASRKSMRPQESQESQQSVTGIPREFDYLYRASQNDDHVLALDVNSPVSLSIGVVCVAQRDACDNNPRIKAHTLQKTFYSYPKNSEEKIKKAIEDRIENDVANFKFQGYNVTTYTFGLPFEVEEITNISRGYDGKTKMLRAARNKKNQENVKQNDDTEDSKGKAKKARK